MHCLYFVYVRKIYVRARVKTTGHWKSTDTEIAPEITVLMSDQTLFPLWFSCWGKSYPIQCEHSLIFIHSLYFIYARKIYVRTPHSKIT